MTNKKHTHIYDVSGKQICCSLEEKIDRKSPPPLVHKADDGHNHSHDHSHGNESNWKVYLPAIVSFILLISGIALDYFDIAFFNGWIRILWYAVAYIPVGLPVVKEAFVALKKGEVFTEFFLMSIATIGAFAIGEYPEGVAVMLFYAVGELFQSAAVRRAKDNITALLDVRPKIANVLRNNSFLEVNPNDVKVDETIQIKVGEKVPLDGTLLSTTASLNTAALTGESKPQSVVKGENVLAGSINMDGVIEVKTSKLFNDSSVSRILELVQNATSKKAKTELLIRRLAKVYTPIVVYLAIAVCFVPYFFVDKLKEVNTMVMDKTGTVTKGVFKIKDIEVIGKYSKEEFMTFLLAIESKSTHPIAKAIMEYSLNNEIPEATDIKEIAGKGLQGTINGTQVVAGNKKLMTHFNISAPKELDSIVESIVLVGIDNQFVGYVTIADEMKEDAKETIAAFKKEGIDLIIMLSGDKDSITQQVASELGISIAKGGLLPEDKLNEVELLKQDATKTIAFIGDGINDAPVLAASDVGIAMGAMGSDVAIETADVIIQTDQPSKVVTGIQIAKSTQKIIWQNIFLAFGIKIIVLILGAGGLATMWEAVFADVGVALLAILNAVRLQRMKW